MPSELLPRHSMLKPKPLKLKPEQAEPKHMPSYFTHMFIQQNHKPSDLKHMPSEITHGHLQLEHRPSNSKPRALMLKLSPSEMKPKPSELKRVRAKKRASAPLLGIIPHHSTLYLCAHTILQYNVAPVHAGNARRLRLWASYLIIQSSRHMRTHPPVKTVCW